ncbi:MAG TPA: DUF4340 domain-containing protein [Candidatus Binataceae bacterium]|nr:DUF4340 domain-containing protein [Candidatus Binataceae bacterium]
MPLRNTIIVIVLLLLIGGYALYQRHQPPPEKNPKVYALDAKDIRKIELRSPGRDLVLERGGPDQWKILKPVQAEADHFTVDAIANQVASLEITDTADAAPSDLAPFGLKVPAVVLTVTTKDGKTLPAILVGEKAPIGNASFIKVADKPAVLLVNPAFAAMVNKHLDDVRSRSFFTFKPDDAHKIVIAKGTQTLELKRDLGDRWTIVKPRDYPADDTAVTSFLKALGAAQIARFIDDHPSDPSKYGLANPSLAITLASAARGSAETMRFGFSQPEAGANAIYARTGNSSDSPVYTVPISVFNLANKSFDDLRDKTVMNFDPKSVASVHFVGGPVDETLAHTADKKWTISSQDKTAPAELPVAESLLDQLHNLRATKIPQDPMTDPKHFGMVTPTLTITLTGKDGKELGVLHASTLEITQTAENSDQKPVRTTTAYVTTSLDPAVFEVNAQAVRDLEETGNRLRSDVLPTPTPSPSASSTPH